MSVESSAGKPRREGLKSSTERVGSLTAGDRLVLQPDFRTHRMPSAPLAVIRFGAVPGAVPGAVMDWFEMRSRMYMRQSNYRPKNFGGFFVVNHASGERTYTARQRKTYLNGDTEDVVHLLDVDPTGTKEGHAEMRLAVTNERVYFKDKPFVGYNATYEHFRRRGLGRRRLLLMNELSHMLYDLPLHSDTLVSLGKHIGAKRLWEQLVLDGLAEQFQEGINDRFRFIG
jgi:hypothetical protein